MKENYILPLYIFYTLINKNIEMSKIICSCPFDWFNSSFTVSIHSFSIIVLGHPRYDKLARWRPSTITSQKSRYITQHSKQMPFFTSNQNILFLMGNLFVDDLFPLKISSLSITQPESAYHIWCTLHHVTWHIETRHVQFN